MNYQNVESLFKELHKASGDNLNQLINNGSVVIPACADSNFGDLLRNFINTVTEFYLEDNDSAVLDELSKYDNCDRFIDWVKDYVNEAIQPIKETAFLKEFSLEEFVRISRFCYENYVLYDSDGRLVEGADENWTIEQIETLRKVILTVAEMQVLRLYPRNIVLERVNEIFRMSDDFGNILFDIISENEDRLWKYLMYKRQEHLESMVESFVDMNIN